MSDSNGGAVGAPVIHENGPSRHDAGRGNDGPPAPPAQRMKPSDIERAYRLGGGDLQAGMEQRARASQGREPTPTSRQHVGEFDKALQARQGQEQPPAQQPQDKAPPEAQNPEQAAAADEARDELEAVAGEGQTAGMTDAEVLAKYREWESSDLFPDELMGKFHPVKVRGEERYVDTEELRKGYIRFSDYQERGKEVKAREDATKKYRETMEQHFEAIKDPNQFLELYESNGYGDQLMQVATMLAKREKEGNALIHAHGVATARSLGYTQQQIEAGHADRDHRVLSAMETARGRLADTRRIETENRKLSAERQRFEDERKQAKYQQDMAKASEQFSRQIGQLRPMAFRAHGIEDNQRNREVFIDHLREVVPPESMSREGFTRDQIMNAAQLMREREQDKQAQLNGGQRQPSHMSPEEWRVAQQAQSRRGNVLPPGRTGTGAGQRVVPQTAQRKGVGDLERERRQRYIGK